MNKEKVNHPYIVPDGFFEEFKLELEDKLNDLPEQPRSRVLEGVKTHRIILNIFKYAAIIIFSFLLGRESSLLFRHSNSSFGTAESLSVEAVYSQVSADDITEFYIENSKDDLLKLNNTIK